LLIDADPDVLRLMTSVFAEDETELVTCQTPQQGLALLMSREVKCVLLDVSFAHTPECLGFLGALRSLPDTTATPVIVTSAMTGPEVIRQVLGLGARKFIPKPFLPSEILREVRSLCA
jgi:DNA-binding response OmpR family regulator